MSTLFMDALLRYFDKFLYTCEADVYGIIVFLLVLSYAHFSIKTNVENWPEQKEINQL